MKIHFRVAAGLSIELEGEDEKGLFEKLAKSQEVFGAESNCGLCESTHLRFRVRVVDKFRFYEINCLECDGRFSFGQVTEAAGGGLFPKRYDENRVRLPNRGWSLPPKQLPAAAGQKGRR